MFRRINEAINYILQVARIRDSDRTTSQVALGHRTEGDRQKWRLRPYESPLRDDPPGATARCLDGGPKYQCKTGWGPGGPPTYGESHPYLGSPFKPKAVGPGGPRRAPEGQCREKQKVSS